MQQPATEQNYQPRPYTGQLEADDGQWIRPARDYASTRFSSLNQIDAKNAKDLKLAFTFSTGMTRGNEAAPLVVNNTMYIVTPFPNNLYALDLTKPGAPMKWVYEPVPTPASQGVACCDVVNRGALRNGHFRLGDGAVAGQVDRTATKEMQDVYAALEARAAHANELVRGALEPGGHHEAVVMPHRPEAFPIAGIAPHGPVFQQLADGELIEQFLCHKIYGRA